MNSESGFTIVEVIVTLIIVSLFLTVFFQSFLLLESQRINVARQAKASDIAYTNLRKFPSKPSTLNCNQTPIVISTATYNFVAESDTTVIGANTQTVTAYAPNGCDSTDTTKFKNDLVKIVSTVTYGSESISHVSYVQ